MNIIRLLCSRLTITVLLALSGRWALAQDVVLLIDNSGSMAKNDPRSLTKQAVAQFIGEAAHGMRLAFILFDQGVYVLSPLTPIDDSTRFDILTHLDRINFRGKRTNSGVALRRAIDELKSQSVPRARAIGRFPHRWDRRHRQPGPRPGDQRVDPQRDRDRCRSPRDTGPCNRLY